jgi:hypothetical protein
MASDAPDAFKDLGLEFLWSYVAANQVAGASAELILHGLKETPEYSAPFPGCEKLTGMGMDLPVWVVIDPGCEECGWGSRAVGGLYPSEAEAKEVAAARDRDVHHYCEVLKIPED